MQTTTCFSVIFSVFIFGKANEIGLVYYDSTVNVSNVLTYLANTGATVPENVTIKEIGIPTENIAQVIDTVCDDISNSTSLYMVVGPCYLLHAVDATVAPLNIPVIGVSTDTCLGQPAIPYLEVTSVKLYNLVTDVLHRGGITQVAIVTDKSEEVLSSFRSVLSENLFEASVLYLTKSKEHNALSVSSWLSKITGSDAMVTCIVLLLDEIQLHWLYHMISNSDITLEDYTVLVVMDEDEDVPISNYTHFNDVLWIRQSFYVGGNGVVNISMHDYLIAESLRVVVTELDSNTLIPSDKATTTSHHCGHKNITLSQQEKHMDLRQRLHNAFNTSLIRTQYDILKMKMVDNTSWPEVMATWSEDNGFQELSESQLFQERSTGLGNITLKVGLAESPPFTRKLPNNTGWEGFCIDVLDELASRLNFRYELIHSPDRLWGTVDDKGNWNGVVEQVRREDVDLGIGPITLTPEREGVIDFTKPYLEEGAGIIMRRFEDKSSKIFRMFKPFSESVWLTIAGTLVVVGVVLCLVNYCSPIRDETEDKISNSDNIWIVYESYMEQGAEKSPPNISGRCILGFWWIFTIIMVASYKANLVAFLTVSFSERPINSILDLADQTTIVPLVKQGSNLYQELQKGETAIFRKLWSNMQAAPPVTSSEEALDLVLTGNYAFLTDQSAIEFLRTTDCDNLMSAETPFNTGGIGFIVPESSPLLEMLSFSIIQLQEAGLTRKWRQKWWSSSEMCPSDTKASSVQRLELESTGGPFLVFVGSTTLALICLALECIWYKRRNWKTEKSDVDESISE